MPQMFAEAEWRNRLTSVWHSQRPQLNGSLNYHLNRISLGGGGGVSYRKINYIVNNVKTV